MQTEKRELWPTLKILASPEALTEIEDDLVPVLDDVGLLGTSRETWSDPAYAALRAATVRDDTAPDTSATRKNEALDHPARYDAQTRECLCVYFARGTDPARAAALLCAALDDRFGADALATGRIRVEPVAIPDEDWATQWKEFFRPIRVSPRLLVLPAWWDTSNEPDGSDNSDVSAASAPCTLSTPSTPSTVSEAASTSSTASTLSTPSTSSGRPAPIILRINPGRAFGSGTHATTQLSLRFLERAVRPGDRVLDFGAGSGILSFAARALGAGRVVAIEVDEECLENFQENARINAMEGTIDYRIGSSEQIGSSDLGGAGQCAGVDETYDVIVCNVLFERVSAHLDALARHLSPGGPFILSGFLVSESETVAARLENLGLTIDERENLEEWQAMSARRGVGAVGDFTRSRS